MVGRGSSVPPSIREETLDEAHDDAVDSGGPDEGDAGDERGASVRRKGFPIFGPGPVNSCKASIASEQAAEHAPFRPNVKAPAE